MAKLEKGKISVDTENLFPIIKKWLYSEHDIFMRELISNAFDAITKLERLSALGKFDGETGKGLIKINVDKDKKTITISDNGLGMTKDEVNKYINQIAFSGAKDFLEKYQDGKEDSQIIGHFGLGFFSSYMVSELVEIDTLSFEKDAKAVKWSCDGTTEFSIGDGDKKERGTTVTLHINKESENFLDETKIKDLITKYSNFLPVEIQLTDKKVNAQHALWNNAPSKIKDKEYNEFYKKLFPYEPDPLFNIHLSIDYPFNLKGILYFPKIKKELDITTKGRLKLFCNNVFVSDNIIDIIPQYLHLLQGVIDSPDIPLNVSRSFLQSDSNVKKIGGHIATKIADKLKSIFNKDRKQFEEYWKDISPFIKYACLSEDKFYDKVKDILVLKTTEDKYITLKEYQENDKNLKDKIIYTSDTEGQISYIKKAVADGHQVVVLDSPIDNHFIQHVESKNSPLSFMRVDSDFSETLPTEDDKDKENDKKEDPKEKAIQTLFQEKLENKELSVKLKKLAHKETAAMITQSEQMRRFTEMSNMMSGQGGTSNLLIGHSLILNKNNSLIKKIIELKEDKEKTGIVTDLCKNVYDLALLQQNSLKGEELEKFVLRTTRLVEEGIS